MIATISDWIRSLPNWVALAVVFGAPALEASAFFGFLFPGEIAVFVGGVIAYEGRLGLGSVIVAAVAGAVIGDTVGYWVGRRFGRRLLHFLFGKVPFLGKRLDGELDRAQAYLKRRGGRAVFFGRYTAALRVLVPGLAGMSDMHYPRFLFWNVTGGATWAVLFVLLGYFAGAAWHEVERYASRVGLLLLALVVLAFIAVRVVRRYRSDPERARALRARAARVVPVAWLLRRFPEAAAWMGRRFAPREPVGLPLTFVAIVGAACAVSLALLIPGVSHARVTYLDSSVQRFVLDHRTAWATNVNDVVTWLGSTAVLAPLIAFVSAILVIRSRAWRPVAGMLVALGGAIVLYNALKLGIDRPRPPVSHMLVHVGGESFPSGHATAAVAVYGMLAAVLWARWSSPRRILVWPVAFVLASLVGLSRLYLGVHWFTDVLGGYALGGLWLAIVLSAMLVTASRARRTQPDDVFGTDASTPEEPEAVSSSPE
jgi:membrane protein DedA with SNARE-associated domain/membrane-associated phospholipid phosphatase